MVSLKEIQLRTEMSESDARLYQDMAGDRVRLFLGYKPDEDITRFSAVISDIAVLLYQKHTEQQAAQKAWIDNAGVQSRHLTEGNVSVNETYAVAGGTSEIGEAYETRMTATLQTLARYRRVHVYGSMESDERRA